ncbi:INO80 complex subunit Ies4-domain-containing protein [Phyllosticta paracitricarpa]
MPITQKLGPKANQGAINAGLRALDRSGKPCRRWEKKGFQLKSFTGVSWEIPTWRAPSKKNTGVDEHGDVKSDTTSNSETAKVNESSAMASEKSSSGGNMDTPNKPLPNLASSPIPEMTPL